MYQYLLEVEVMIFMRYKMQFCEIEKNMSIIDAQQFIKMLEYKIKEEDKQISKSGNKLMKSLVAIRDILNYMTLNDTNLR